MKINTSTARFWSTASFGGNTDIPPLELLSLGDHLGMCKNAQGPFFALHCMAEAAQGFVASHLVTTMVGVALLIGIAALAL